MEKLILDIGYNNNTLYKDIEILIPSNGIISIIGDNGSGKSTFYKTLLGIIPPIKGSIPQYVTEHIAIVSDYVHLPEEITVSDILCLLGLKKINYAADNYPDFQHYIMNYKTQRISTLSSGQRRIVEIYAVLASGKKIIVLDEASNSLDYSNKELFLSHVKKLSKDKILFFHTSHEMHDVVFLEGSIYGLFKTDKLIKRFTDKITSDNIYNFLKYRRDNEEANSFSI